MTLCKKYRFAFFFTDNFFDIAVYKTWEFDTTSPARTCIFPFVTVGIAYSLLKSFDPYSIEFLGITLKTPFFLITFPRIVMCLISFISDFCLFKMCRLFNYPHEKRLLIFASSCIMLTFVNRTFSNTIELVLSSFMLYYVLKSQKQVSTFY